VSAVRICRDVEIRLSDYRKRPLVERESELIF